MEGEGHPFDWSPVTVATVSELAVTVVVFLVAFFCLIERRRCLRQLSRGNFVLCATDCFLVSAKTLIEKIERRVSIVDAAAEEVVEKPISAIKPAVVQNAKRKASFV